MWRDEEEYFSDAEVVQYCEVCGEELYYGDHVLRDNASNCYYCSVECAKVVLGAKESEEAHESIKCTCCGKELTDEFESIISEGQRFCDISCLLRYNDIEGMEM